MRARSPATRRSVPEAPYPHRLQHGGDPADGDGREHRPRKEPLAAAGCPDDDGGGQHDPGDTENGELEAEPDGQRYRRLLVGLVADARALVGHIGLHDGDLPEA